MIWMLSACIAGSDPVDSTPEDSAEPNSLSAGCGSEASLTSGQMEIDAGAEGDGLRGAWLSLPADYDPDTPHNLVIGFPGTNWVGEQIQPYLDLECHSTQPTVYVYPDPLWRDFQGWGNLGGWVLGPHASPADGAQDLVFTAALLDTLEARLCVDTERVFVTGHSWGGDMAAVTACFMGDRVRAAVPIAANRPYWFEPSSGDFSCTGQAAVWTLFGQNDTHFTGQPYPGAYGDEQDAFWAQEHACGAETDLSMGAADCHAYSDCSAETRTCLYEAEAGHQAPSWFALEATAWWEGMD